MSKFIELAENFLETLSAQLDPSAASLAKFMQEKTFLGGKPFNFRDHEFQGFITKLIEENPGKTFVVLKCSQLGVSELFNRIVLSRMALRSGEGVLVSFPSKTFSQEVLKTRFSEVIRESPTLSALLDRNVDSASVKKFVNGSILYGLGGSKNSNSSLLNRPISIIFLDEIDRQDRDTYTGFESRTAHTADEDLLTLMVSTPTVQGIGVDAEYSECGIQYQGKIKCKCGYTWEPDYYEDVKIPGYKESLRLLTKQTAASLDIDGAYLECPECGCHITKKNSKVVYEKVINKTGGKLRIGIALNPFCAPGIISMPRLVRSSLVYTSHVEFLNQGLGKTASLSDSSILATDLRFTVDDPPGTRVVGLDVGKVCRFMSGVLKYDTTIHIDIVEDVMLNDLEGYLEKFFKKHAVMAGVMDSAPYSDLVYKLVRKYPRLFSAIYSDPMPRPPELYKLKMHDKYGEIVRQVNITKNSMMDMMAGSLSDFITFQYTPNDSKLIQHVTSMRKVRDYRYSEMIYKWVKPENGEDHYFHSLVYLYTAAKLALADLALGAFVAPVTVGKLNTVGKKRP